MRLADVLPLVLLAVACGAELQAPYAYDYCVNPKTGADEPCGGGMGCVDAQLGADNGVGRAPYCACNPYMRGQRCMGATPELTIFPAPREWQAPLEGKSFAYRPRGLQALYVVVDIEECKVFCEMQNSKEAYDNCGAVVYHDEDGVGICEAITAKPTGVCEEWLFDAPGWTVAYMAPASPFGCI